MERRYPEHPYNPVENLPPREQALERIIVTPRFVFSEDEMKRRLSGKLYRKQSENEAEMEKTEDETAIIASAFGAVTEVVRRYGGRPLELTPGHVHLINLLDLSTEEQAGLAGCGGDYDSGRQEANVYFAGASGLSTSELLRRVTHEALHFNSFQSAVEVESNLLVARRMGLTYGAPTVGVGGVWLNEAVTERLAKALTKERLAHDKIFRDDASLTRDLLSKMSSETDHDDVVGFEIIDPAGDRGTTVRVHQFAYPDERQKLERLLSDLAAKRPADFPDREAAFDAFARAYFTGNLLPLARVLEDTYGKNALRRLMEGEELMEPKAESLEPKAEGGNGETITGPRDRSTG